MGRVGYLGTRKRSLQSLLREVYTIQEDGREAERTLRVVREILQALAKQYWEPGHACGMDCPCQSKPQ